MSNHKSTPQKADSKIVETAKNVTAAMHKMTLAANLYEKKEKEFMLAKAKHKDAFSVYTKAKADHKMALTDLA